MENILNKKITCPLWAVISIVAFITLAVGTGNITVSENFIDAIKLITVVIIGTVTTINIGKSLLDKASLIKEFIANYINHIIVALIIILIGSLVFGIVHQINIGAMSEKELKKIAIVGILVVTILLIASITNIIKLTISQKRNKRRNRMRKLASLIARQNINFNTDSLNTIQIKALVTDLYSLSVQDITTIADVDMSPLYNSDTFMSFINENANVTVTKDLGFFKNSLDYLVANHCVSTMEAATAKVVTFYVDRDILTLL